MRRRSYSWAIRSGSWSKEQTSRQTASSSRSIRTAGSRTAVVPRGDRHHGPGTGNRHTSGAGRGGRGRRLCRSRRARSSHRPVSRTADTVRRRVAGRDAGDCPPVAPGWPPEEFRLDQSGDRDGHLFVRGNMVDRVGLTGLRDAPRRGRSRGRRGPRRVLP